MQARAEGRPYAYQSVLLVCGLLLLAPALLTLADVLGADLGEAYSAGAFVWTSLLLAGAALWPAVGAQLLDLRADRGDRARGRRCSRSSTGRSTRARSTTYRWLLAVLALAYALASLLLRGPAPRHSEQMVNAAGLAVLAIALTGLLPALFGTSSPFGGAATVLPNGWELVVLAAGCGLVAYGAVDRAPGPGLPRRRQPRRLRGLRGRSARTRRCSTGRR